MEQSLSRFADVNEASSGLNAQKVLEFNISNGYEWVEPPLSSMGYIYPTDDTYHPLLNSTQYEIAQNLFTIQGDPKLSSEDKARYSKKVQTIIEESYYVKYMGSFYFTFIILTVIILFILLFRIPVGGFIYGLIRVMILYGLGCLLYAQTMSIGAGKSEWLEFINMYNSMSSSGKNSVAILNELKENDQRAEELYLRKMEASQNRRNGNSSSSFSGALLGGIFGSMLTKK